MSCSDYWRGGATVTLSSPCVELHTLSIVLSTSILWLQKLLLPNEHLLRGPCKELLVVFLFVFSFLLLLFPDSSYFHSLINSLIQYCQRLQRGPDHTGPNSIITLLV